MTCIAVPDPAFAGDARFVLADRVVASLDELDAGVWAALGLAVNGRR